MFGSPSASTPFAKFRPVGPSSTSLSFGQQSANKRKRDQISNAAPAEPINAHTKVRGALVLSSIPSDTLEGSTTRLLSNGQLLVVPNEGFAAYYQHNIFRPSEFAVIDKKNEGDYRGVIDGGVGPSDTTDLVACTTNGRLTIVNVAQDGAQVHLHHKLQLREEEERITLACHAGNVALLGTSSEELYLVRRYGRTLNADRLQRNRGLFANLFTSGARLIGISSSAPNDGKVVKLLPVPMSFFLLALGSSSLSLWSDWTNPGSEQLVWESSVKDVLMHDLSGLNLFGGASVLTMIDACLMPVDAGAEKGTLLVLSSCENRTNSSSGALWMHTLEVQFAAGATGASISILHRLLLAEHVDTQSTAAAPRIHHLSPSWKIFATWSAESHCSQGQGHEQDRRESVASEMRTVHGAQIDVLNQSLLNATVSREGSSQRQALLDSLRCTSAVNSCVDVRAVLDAAVVKGHDGVTIITNDGTISVFCPPLPKRNLTEFPLSTSKLRDRQQQGSTNSLGAMQVADGVNVLHCAALGELATEDVGKAMSDVFDQLSTADAAAAVQATSTKLMNRSPTGEYWGSVGAVGTGRGSAGRGAGTSAVGARALTQYQMVHRLVETKLNAHKKLIEIVSESDIATFAGIRQSLLKDHQTLLLCAGLSGAVEEAQLRYSSGSGPEDPAGTSSTQRVALEALAIVAQGIERAVRVGRGLSLEEIDSQGLSVVDMFYAEAWLVFDGLSSIVQALRDSQASLAQKSIQLETTFAVSSIVLSALQLAMVGEGAEVSTVAANCHQKVRDVVVSLIGLLRDAADGRNSATSIDSRVAGRNSARSSQLGGVAVDREGKRLVELCSAALQSYAMEAVASEDGTVENMPKDWRDKYHYVKGICSALLLSTGNHQAGFALFAEHLYCIGLMECTQRDPQTLQARLEDTVRKLGTQVGTDTVPLATGCFLWLEAHNRLADILALGTTNPALLEEFLKTRSHLAWMHHLRSGHFRHATVAAVEHASTVPMVGKAATLLSIAKLSAKLAGDSPEPSQASQSSVKRLFTPAPSSSSSPHKASYKTETSESELSSAVQNLNADLAVIRAQEVVLETLPNLQADKSVRMNVSDLVKLVARALRHYGASATLAVVDEEHPLHAADASALPRLFGMGLSLLSMQMDLLDTLVAAAAAAADAADRDGESATVLRTPLSLMEQQHTQQSQQARLAQLRKQEESFAALLVDLWGSLIAANLSTWLELSCYPTLGAQEEQAVRTDCWLFAAVASAVSEASSGNLRGELIPTVQGNEGESLLQMALASSQVISKRLGAEGEVENLQGSNVNQRVVHIIKVCVNMALGEGAIMQ